ncbi:SpoIIE family protein phosphatase [Streptomyces sp. NBC_00670]|jgi:GAF domain-containing protein|uniref:SpoIIE family protein phosphatase n=1 Tax=Streptomyces sp. NBC_00670 TaxID=2975804 RepID=UPI002E3774D5|nr:SpoIIE family protein phosphatase [Streptomyces sp. NBC_00670]
MADDPSPPDPASPGHPLLSLTLAAMLDDLHALSGAVYLLSPGEPVLEMKVMAGLPRAFASPWERVGLGSPVPVADALRERRLVWVNGEVEMAHRYPRIATVLPYPFCLAAVPLATEDTAYGALFVTWPGSHSPQLSDRERHHLTTACERLVTRLERAAAERHPVGPEPDILPPPTEADTAGRSGALEAVRMAARLPYGLCALDLHGRITFANRAAGELLGVPSSGLPGTLLWAAVPWLNDPGYEDHYRAALLSRQVTTFVALRPPGSWLSFRLYPGGDGLSLRISPSRAVSRAGGGERGTGTAEPSRQVGGRRLVTIAHVLNLAGALTEAVGVEDVVQLVADEIAPALGSQGLMMLGSHGGRLHILGHRGFPDDAVERWDGTPLAAPIPSARVLSTGVPAFFESPEQLERLYPLPTPTSDGMAAWACLPLIASGRPVGTWVVAYARPHAFPADERAVLTSLSGLIAQALERALLYDAKHRLAHGLQQALLPPSLPALPGLETAARYLPATQGMEIGGDFYDVVPTYDRAVAAIGDVQGHNVTAAGLMGQIRTAVRAYTTVGQGPGEVMRSTNRLLIDLGADLFASCVYLSIDSGRGRMVLARAGHPPPLLRRPDGRVRVLDLAGGPLLGIQESAVYPTAEVAFPRGSVLVLYTDGLIESPGVDIDDALDGLAERLAGDPAEPLDALADRLVGPGAAGERPDDVALLLLRAV